MNGEHATVFGEILWDLIGDEKYIGGAPFNFAAHFIRLGNSVDFFSSVGRDALGEQALAEMRKLNISTGNVSISNNKPTGAVTVSLNDGLPRYSIKNDVAWDWITQRSHNALTGREGQILYFGTLAQRSSGNRKFLAALVDGNNWKNIFCDLNIRQPFIHQSIIEYSLAKCTILKMNDEEALCVCKTLFNAEMPISAICLKIAERFHIQQQIVTCGSRGVYVFENEHLHFTPARSIRVADTVGAGDAFSAAFIYAIHKGMELKDAAEFSCRLAEFVASQSGAIPDYSPEFVRRLMH